MRYLQNWNASIHFVSDDKIESEITDITIQQTAEHQAKAMIDSEFHGKPNFIASEEQSVPAWNGYTIQPEKTTKKPKASGFTFMPHFEHSSYEIYVPEGKNKVS